MVVILAATQELLVELVVQEVVVEKDIVMRQVELVILPQQVHHKVILVQLVGMARHLVEVAAQVPQAELVVVLEVSEVQGLPVLLPAHLSHMLEVAVVLRKMDQIPAVLEVQEAVVLVEGRPVRPQVQQELMA